ncbi:glycosyltransferase, exosortase A system-associated [Methylomonas sp. EFPC1]|uniref:TIGR04063 family PEP-CTERM/XrtA system glycosyltransferase n=1 Tax=unclassified Methylomonas TaxID=2608980 RepID=UPI00051C5F3D|nr:MULTISPECIES: TIGR04063 family PEP-CTERM/XrtA system glycosyltransferase [unclassified Methylomonas]QBC28726.1 glycosyltransferase, exosortase A system-associated [Methylomonas sp. LW13]QSB00391.1 glycosyltransferase, exosortase A system-associated [Methylomonas sp. EFPC1]
MKILHILDHSIPLHSGYTFRTRAILEQQRKLGWETFHVTSAKHQVAEAPIETVDGLTFYRSVIPRGLAAKLPVLNQWAIVQSLAERLDEIIPQIKPDILHAHSPALNGLAALKVAKKYGLPLVYECRAFWEDAAVDHGTTHEGSLRYRLTKALETHVFKRADAVTTICEGLRRDIIGRGVAAEKITVIPNAVDIDKFTYGEAAEPNLQAELGLSGKIVLGFIGSFYAYEGLLLLLDALPAIIQQQPDVRLLLVGGGPQQQQILQKIEALSLQDCVILPGRVAHDQVQRYYNLVDIFVYPRLAMRLTDLVTPLKPLEAMAQGRLLVASDVGGHHELIRDRETGYIFKAGDKTALAQTVLAVLDQQDQWEQVRRAGRRYVEEERNWQRSVSHYQAVYGRIMAGNDGR